MSPGSHVARVGQLRLQQRVGVFGPLHRCGKQSKRIVAFEARAQTGAEQATALGFLHSGDGAGIALRIVEAQFREAVLGAQVAGGAIEFWVDRSQAADGVAAQTGGQVLPYPGNQTVPAITTVAAEHLVTAAVAGDCHGRVAARQPTHGVGRHR